jgi:ubiquinone/menaquinone biosynthesis C-methylase UbiE
MTHQRSRFADLSGGREPPECAPRSKHSTQQKGVRIQGAHAPRSGLALALLLLLALPLSAQDKKPDGPPGVEVYQGRRVAQTMHWLGAEWLVRDEREREERCSLMLTTLDVKPGMNVCDMGCGNGFYTVQLARLVGKKGKVYAVDIQPKMLEFLKDRAAKEKIPDGVVEPILGELWDPKLPEGKLDLILLVDVYHEFSHPEQMLAAMRKSLAPGGKIVLVEFRGEDPEVPIKPEHKMTKDQINKEMNANGFKVAKEFEKLPWQHMMWFEKVEEK